MGLFTVSLILLCSPDDCTAAGSVYPRTRTRFQPSSCLSYGAAVRRLQPDKAHSRCYATLGWQRQFPPNGSAITQARSRCCKCPYRGYTFSAAVQSAFVHRIDTVITIPIKANQSFLNHLKREWWAGDPREEGRQVQGAKREAVPRESTQKKDRCDYLSLSMLIWL